MNDYRRGGFTLVELVVVLIVIAILAAIALPRYNKAIERIKNKEAKVSLNLIASVEKSVFYETRGYISCDYTNDCNSKLHLHISGSNWDYKVDTSGNSFTATAQRRGGKRRWVFDYNGDTDTETLQCSGSSTYCE